MYVYMSSKNEWEGFYKVDKCSNQIFVYPQVGFAPCFLGAFLGISGALNGLTVEENVTKLKRVSFHHKPELNTSIVTT